MMERTFQNCSTKEDLEDIAKLYLLQWDAALTNWKTYYLVTSSQLSEREQGLIEDAAEVYFNAGFFNYYDAESEIKLVLEAVEALRNKRAKTPY